MAKEYKCYIANNPAPARERYIFREYGTNRKVTIHTDNVNERIQIAMFIRSQKQYGNTYYRSQFDGHNYIGISGDRVYETEHEITICTNESEKCTIVVSMDK